MVSVSICSIYAFGFKVSDALNLKSNKPYIEKDNIFYR